MPELRRKAGGAPQNFANPARPLATTSKELTNGPASFPLSSGERAGVRAVVFSSNFSAAFSLELRLWDDSRLEFFHRLDLHQTRVNILAAGIN